MRRLFIHLPLLAGALVMTGSLLAQDVVGPGSPPPVPRGRNADVSADTYIVQFSPGTSRNDRANAVNVPGASTRFNYGNISSVAITAPNANALQGIRNNPLVQDVIQAHVIGIMAKGGSKGGGGSSGGGGGGSTGGGGGGSCCSAPGTFDSEQIISYSVQRTGLPVAGSDGEGIGIAIVDSGIDFQHTDLAPSTAASFSAYGGSCDDDGGHGTHVSGITAALNNNQAIVGVAPAATLYCVKVLDGALTGDDTTLMAGLDWVISNHDQVTPPIRVVNLSLGRPLNAGETLADVSGMHSLIQQLYNLGIVVVVAAGNDPTLEITDMVPAAFPEVLTVASTTANEGVKTCAPLGYDIADVKADDVSVYTTDGAGVTISAPGEEETDYIDLPYIGCNALMYGTLSTTMGSQGASRKIPYQGGIAEARGTSFSAPLVSGIVARLMQMALIPVDSGSTTTENARTWISDNADRKGVAPVDNPMGNVFYTYTFDGTREGIAQAPQP